LLLEFDVHVLLLTCFPNPIITNFVQNVTKSMSICGVVMPHPGQLQAGYLSSAVFLGAGAGLWYNGV